MIKGHVFDKQLFQSKAFAIFQDFFLNGLSGILKGIGKECKMTYTNSSITINDGYFVIKGRTLEEVGSETISVSNDTAYCILVCEIDLNLENTKSEFNQAKFKVLKNISNYPDLRKENILENAGVYQFEFARFKTTIEGISDFQDTREFINYEGIYKMISDELESIKNKSEIAFKSDLPEKSVLRLKKTNQQEIPNEKEVKIQYGVIGEQIQNLFWENAEVTVNKAGRYLIAANVQFMYHEYNSALKLLIRKNGKETLGEGLSNATYVIVESHAIVELEKDDKIEFIAMSSGGTSYINKGYVSMTEI